MDYWNCDVVVLAFGGTLVGDEQAFEDHDYYILSSHVEGIVGVAEVATSDFAVD